MENDLPASLAVPDTAVIRIDNEGLSSETDSGDRARPGLYLSCRGVKTWKGCPSVSHTVPALRPSAG